MPLDPTLLDILICPQCQGRVQVVEGGHALRCLSCALVYAIQNGIPIMQSEMPLARRTEQAFASPEIGTTAVRANFQVTQGPDAGLRFHLFAGTCRALGRTESDPHHTSRFNVDLSLALDEGTRSLVMAYIARQFQGARQTGTVVEGERLGGFLRAPDIVLGDTGISRLHAMLFVDTAERVGVLDLVSKNGTFVDGREVESYLLKPGNVLEIGETKVVFEGIS